MEGYKAYKTTLLFWCFLGVLALAAAMLAGSRQTEAASRIGRLDITHSIKTDGIRIMIVKDNNTNREFLVTGSGGVAEIKPKE